MSASALLSKHIPGLASGVVSITTAEAGVKVVDTGLIDITSAVGTLTTAHAANQESHVRTEWFGLAGVSGLTVGQVRITVTKGGTADAAAADSAVDVALMAHGDR